MKKSNKFSLEMESGQRDSVATAERERLKEPEREVGAMLEPNQIPKRASAFFFQAELDSRFES